MINILKYVVKEPESDDHKIGHKFPFNASELLSGENTYLIDKFFEDSNVEDEDDKYEELDEFEGEKLDKAENSENIKMEEAKGEDIRNEEEKNETENNINNLEEIEFKEEMEYKEDKEPTSDGEVDAIVQKFQTITIGETVGTVKTEEAKNLDDQTTDEQEITSSNKHGNNNLEQIAEKSDSVDNNVTPMCNNSTPKEKVTSINYIYIY